MRALMSHVRKYNSTAEQLYTQKSGRSISPWKQVLVQLFSSTVNYHTFLQGKWERFVSEKEVMTTASLHIHLTSLSLDPTGRGLLLYNEYAIALSHTLHCPSWMINRLQKFIYICIDKRFLQFNHLIFSFVAFLKVSLLSTDIFFFFQAAPFPFKLNRTHVLMWQIFF